VNQKMDWLWRSSPRWPTRCAIYAKSNWVIVVIIAPISSAWPPASAARMVSIWRRS